MRQALHRELPAFTKFYGLKPWEIERLSFREIETYQRFMNDYLEAQQRGG